MLVSLSLSLFYGHLSYWIHLNLFNHSYLLKDHTSNTVTFWDVQEGKDLHIWNRWAEYQLVRNTPASRRPNSQSHSIKKHQELHWPGAWGWRTLRLCFGILWTDWARKILWSWILRKKIFLLIKWDLSKEEILRLEVARNKPLIFPEPVRGSPQEQSAWVPKPGRAVRIKSSGWELGGCSL